MDLRFRLWLVVLFLAAFSATTGFVHAAGVQNWGVAMIAGAALAALMLWVLLRGR